MDQRKQECLRCAGSGAVMASRWAMEPDDECPDCHGAGLTKGQTDMPTESEIRELYSIASTIHDMLKDGEPVENAYIEQLGDALEGVNMATGWGDEFDKAIAAVDARLSPF